MRFKTWMEAEQQIEVQVANFVSSMIEKAAELLKRDLASGQQPQMFNNYVKQVWPPEAAGRGALVLPNNFPQGIAGQPVRFKLTSDDSRAQAAHDGNGQFAGFTFNIKPFQSLRTPEQIDQYVQALSYSTHHEAEHIYNPGADYDPEEGEDPVLSAMNYMSPEGEARAHSREMAKAYAQAHPNQPFDLAKGQQLLANPHFNNTHRNYFQGLADPKKWASIQQKYPQFTTNPHDQAVKYVNEFLPQYGPNSTATPGK